MQFKHTALLTLEVRGCRPKWRKKWTFIELDGSLCVKLFLTERARKERAVMATLGGESCVCMWKKGRVLMNLITDRQTGRRLSERVRKYKKKTVMPPLLG